MSDDKQQQPPFQEKGSPKGDEQNKPPVPPKLGHEERSGKGPWTTKGQG